MSTPKPTVSKPSPFAVSILQSSVISCKPSTGNSPEKSSTSQAPSVNSFENEISSKTLIEKSSLESFKNNNISAPITTTTTSNSEFVFGQNMLSRVVNAQVDSSIGSEELWQSAVAAAKNDEGDESTVFTVLAKAVATKYKQPLGPTELKDSADELARKRNAAHIHLDDGQSVMTGEEGEHTVVELTCNAYVFNTESRQWTGIGQSYLHLNDDGESGESRLVIRLQSTRRVVVNTIIWPNMPLASVMESKGLRFGAVESGGGTIRSYLLRFPMAASASQLYNLLLTRRDAAVETVASKRARLSQSNSATPPPPTIILTPPVNGDNVTADEGSSEKIEEGIHTEDNDSEKKEKEEKTLQAIFTPPPKTNKSVFVNGASSISILTLPCHVRVSSASGRGQTSKDSIEKAEATVNVIDFPTTNGPSILEVTPSSSSYASSSKPPLLTTIIGLRLAFCLPPELDSGRTLQVFLLPYPSANSSEKDPDAGETKVYQIELDSRRSADRLYRCLLVRLSRLFIEDKPSESSDRKTRISDEQSSDSIFDHGELLDEDN